MPFLGGVPIDPRVTKSGDEGVPVVKSFPESPAAAAYRDIAGKTAAQLYVLSMEAGKYLETFSLKWK